LRGKKNVHGHVHYKTIPDDRYLNVCCENINFTPISLEEVNEIFKKREEGGI
jgi:calcineurin-like phosphoesterase family protein